MKSLDGIKKGHSDKLDSLVISRKIFLSFKAEVFENLEEDEFYIKNSIAKQFNIPFSSIEMCGSGQVGLSVFKDRLFVPGVSDLDIAVISLPLYNKFAEQAHRATKGYTNLTPFPIHKGESTNKMFRSGLTQGFLNPFYMPTCNLKNEWLDFFRKLSNRYYKLFKSINGGVYASEYFFESKQSEGIEIYLNNTDKYDKISSQV